MRRVLGIAVRVNSYRCGLAVRNHYVFAKNPSSCWSCWSVVVVDQGEGGGVDQSWEW